MSSFALAGAATAVSLMGIEVQRSAHVAAEYACMAACGDQANSLRQKTGTSPELRTSQARADENLGTQRAAPALKPNLATAAWDPE